MHAAMAAFISRYSYFSGKIVCISKKYMLGKDSSIDHFVPPKLLRMFKFRMSKVIISNKFCYAKSFTQKFVFCFSKSIA